MDDRTRMLGLFVLLFTWPVMSFGEDSDTLAPRSWQAASQVEEELLYLREETVSIAARHEQPISDAPADVYEITDEDLRRSGAIDLPTVLRRIPGMEVMQMTGADFNVSIRGDNQADANKLLVMGRAGQNLLFGKPSSSCHRRVLLGETTTTPHALSSSAPWPTFRGLGQ